MNCKEFKNIVVDLFDKDPDPQVKAACEQHMSECAECRQYYDDLAGVADSLQPHHSPYQKEQSSKPAGRASIFTLHKIAASFIGILIITGVTFAAIQIWKGAPEAQTSTTEAQTPDTVEVKQQPASLASGEQDEATRVVFEDTELGTMLNQMAAHYQYEVVYKSNAAKHTRLYFTWDKTTPIEDVVATFNKFDRIHISIEDRQLIVR